MVVTKCSLGKTLPYLFIVLINCGLFIDRHSVENPRSHFKSAIADVLNRTALVATMAMPAHLSLTAMAKPVGGRRLTPRWGGGSGCGLAILLITCIVGVHRITPMNISVWCSVSGMCCVPKV